MEHLAFFRSAPGGMAGVAGVAGAIGPGLARDDGAVERFAV